MIRPENELFEVGVTGFTMIFIDRHIFHLLYYGGARLTTKKRMSQLLSLATVFISSHGPLFFLQFFPVRQKLLNPDVCEGVFHKLVDHAEGDGGNVGTC